MKHTPGPWIIHTAMRDGGRTVMDTHGRAVTFTPVFRGSAAADIAEAVANARLIASAPDLADMLGWALNLIEDEPEHRQSLAHARAVLAQALEKS